MSGSSLSRACLAALAIPASVTGCAEAEVEGQPMIIEASYFDDFVAKLSGKSGQNSEIILTALMSGEGICLEQHKVSPLCDRGKRLVKGYTLAYADCPREVNTNGSTYGLKQMCEGLFVRQSDNAKLACATVMGRSAMLASTGRSTPSTTLADMKLSPEGDWVSRVGREKTDTYDRKEADEQLRIQDKLGAKIPYARGSLRCSQVPSTFFQD